MCDCIKRVNDHLVKFNTKIELPFWSASGQLTPFVQTLKVDSAKRGKPRLMAAAYCPFCGERYETTKPTAEQPSKDSLVLKNGEQSGPVSSPRESERADGRQTDLTRTIGIREK